MGTPNPQDNRKHGHTLEWSGLQQVRPDHPDECATQPIGGASLPGDQYSYEPLGAGDLQRILHSVEQSGDLLLLSSVAWNLGHALIDNRDHAQASECFRRVLGAGVAREDRFLIEAAWTAQRLCAALSGCQHPGENLQLAHGRLARSLLQVDQEDVDFVAKILDDDHEASEFDAIQIAPMELSPGRAGKGGAPEHFRTSANGIALADTRMLPISTSTPAERLLEVRFFGHFEISCNAEAVAPGNCGKALAILKYLLAHKGQSVSQDYLMGWLWPESSAKRARWSLNSAIYALRKLLERHLPPVAPPGYIVLEKNSYRLSSLVRISTDTEEFESHIKAGRSLERSGRASEAAAEYRKALEIYCDDYLVEDLYEDWTMVERERLVNTCLDTLVRLALYHMDSGRPQEGIQLCYRMLEMDPCYESAHRLLMSCYARLDLRTQALRQYRLCEQSLRQRYGIAPSQETRALYNELLGS